MINRSEALDKIVGERLRVLDDGFVRVVDYLGNDTSIVDAARVSYGEGTRKLRSNEGLIRYLMRHRHTTPFEMCEIVLHVRVPMDVWRQWIRHRTANVNEYSTRYSVAIDSMKTTKSTEWRDQSSANRQGSSGVIESKIGLELSRKERALHKELRAAYEERLMKGVAREQARKDLPLSTYTEAFWKIDLHNLMNFLRLRMDQTAQSEIRSYATLIGEEVVQRWVPVTWSAFLDYQLNSLYLTKVEVEIVKYIVAGRTEEARQISADKLLKREVLELERKLTKLGIDTHAMR